jgi:endoglucanase
MNSRELKTILKGVLTKPTAPLREDYVAGEIDRFAKEEGARLVKDTFGNRILIYKPRGKKRKGRIGFVAHMDHPGFEIVSVKGNRAIADWRGGVDRKYFKGAKVMVHHDGGVKGRVERITKLAPKRRRVKQVALRLENPVIKGAIAQWDLVPFEMKGKMVVTRAADDLCSVAVQLALLRELKRARVRHEVWLVFTRGEESGFNGTLAMMRHDVLPGDLLLVSMETSRMLAGAEQGKGPVVRLGDRMTVYSGDLCLYMEKCAAKVKKSHPRFKFQRRVMDGGMSEASAFVCHDYTAAGIAFPLGNYHNMGDKPGRGGRPVLRAETIHIDDLLNGLKLMVEMSKNLTGWSDAMGKLVERLQKSNRPFERLLKKKQI